MARNCIGLDIGSSSVKLVQFKSSRRGLSLQNFGVQPLEPQAIVDGAVLNHSAVVEAIQTLASRIRLRGKEVAIAVSGNSVIVKRVTMPPMYGRALDEQMEWEINQNISFNRDEVCVDYTVLEEQTEEGQMEVMLVAAKADVVDQYIAIVRDAGFKPLVVDTAAFSVQNAIEMSGGFEGGKSFAFINVGASFSTLSVVTDLLPVFNRDISSGGNTFTEAIQRQLGISLEQAESFKIGITDAGQSVPPQVAQIKQQVAEQMAGEFQRSIDFFVKDAIDGKLECIYLTGGSALVPELGGAIQSRAQIPVQVLNPFAGVHVDDRRFDTAYVSANAPIATVAAGLAMRHEGDAA